MLEGKCALITGSSGGIGAAYAEMLAAEGCNVMMHGLEDPEVTTALRANMAETHGVEIGYRSDDLTDPAAIQALVATTEEALGPVDILINNAVIRYFAAIEDFKPEDWDQALAVNLTASFHTIRLTLPGMKARNWGRIVNMASTYGLFASPNRVDYVATKHAVIGLTKTVALETAETGITCNAICPAWVMTPNTERRIGVRMAEDGITRDAAIHAMMEKRQPSRRFIEREHIAALVRHLCSEAGASITGAALPIDGGWSAM
jgi:3-hydroxybutyrate dehydrogenase